MASDIINGLVALAVSIDSNSFVSRWRSSSKWRYLLVVVFDDNADEVGTLLTTPTAERCGEAIQQNKKVKSFFKNQIFNSNQQ